MKVRLNAWDNLTSKQRKELDEYVKNKGLEIYQREAAEDFRRYYKLVAIALNNKFGFGKKRILEVFDEISELSRQREQDEVFWAHMDKIVINQIGLEFERENYNDLDK